MSGEDCFAQIIEHAITVFAKVSLTMSLFVMKAPFLNTARTTMRTLDPIRPSQFPNFFKTFSIIYQTGNIQHQYGLPEFICRKLSFIFLTLALFFSLATQALGTHIEPKPCG
jgi:uncharacterized protein YybS (DUF2232 family)